MSRDPSRSSVGLPEKPYPGMRRHDEIEGVLRAASVRRGVGERTDDLQQLEDRARPAMRHDQRHRVRMTRANVHELNVEPVDLRHELGQAFSFASAFRQS